MAKRSLSQKILEAIELGERLNRILNTLPPEIRETIIKYSQRKVVRRRRKRGRAVANRKRKPQAAQAKPPI